MSVDPTRAPTDAGRAWKELLGDAQARPWLLSWLHRRGPRLHARFLEHYRRLLAQPRRLRRRLHRDLGLTLARAALLLALTGVGLNPTPAFANGITVSGVCSLVQAIGNANDTTKGWPNADCAPGDPAGADALTLTANISLINALPAITSAITIEGQGYAIVGYNLFGIFAVDVGANLTLNQMFLSGGSATAGGGIHNEGTIIVRDCLKSSGCRPSRGISCGYEDPTVPDRPERQPVGLYQGLDPTGQSRQTTAHP